MNLIIKQIKVCETSNIICDLRESTLHEKWRKIDKYYFFLHIKEAKSKGKDKGNDQDKDKESAEFLRKMVGSEENWEFVQKVMQLLHYIAMQDKDNKKANLNFLISEILFPPRHLLPTISASILAHRTSLITTVMPNVKS